MPSFFQKAKSYGESALEKASEAAGNLADNIEEAAGKVADSIDPHRLLLDDFVEGAVVVLISRSSGQALEIVESSGRANWFARKFKHVGILPYGNLTLHGKGGEGEDSERAYWTIENPSGRKIRLHCDKNYITIHDGAAKLVRYAAGAEPGEESLFELSRDAQFVLFESCASPNYHVGILADGSLKLALATGTEADACFAVKLISKPDVSTSE